MLNVFRFEWILSNNSVVQIHIHFLSNTGIDNFWKQSFFKSESERENVSTIFTKVAHPQTLNHEYTRN